MFTSAGLLARRSATNTFVTPFRFKMSTGESSLMCAKAVLHRLEAYNGMPVACKLSHSFCVCLLSMIACLRDKRPLLPQEQSACRRCHLLALLSADLRTSAAAHIHDNWLQSSGSKQTDTSTSVVRATQDRTAWRASQACGSYLCVLLVGKLEAAHLHEQLGNPLQ